MTHGEVIRTNRLFQHDLATALMGTSLDGLAAPLTISLHFLEQYGTETGPRWVLTEDLPPNFMIRVAKCWRRHH